MNAAALAVVWALSSTASYGGTGKVAATIDVAPTLHTPNSCKDCRDLVNFPTGNEHPNVKPNITRLVQILLTPPRPQRPLPLTPLEPQPQRTLSQPKLELLLCSQKYTANHRVSRWSSTRQLPPPPPPFWHTWWAPCTLRLRSCDLCWPRTRTPTSPCCCTLILYPTSFL